MQTIRTRTPPNPEIDIELLNVEVIKQDQLKLNLQEPLCSHSHKSRKPVYLVLGSRSSMGRSAFASFLHTYLNPIGSRFRNQVGAGVKHSYIDDCLIQYDSDHDCSVLRQDQP